MSGEICKILFFPFMIQKYDHSFCLESDNHILGFREENCSFKVFTIISVPLILTNSNILIILRLEFHSLWCISNNIFPAIYISFSFFFAFWGRFLIYLLQWWLNPPLVQFGCLLLLIRILILLLRFQLSGIFYLFLISIFISLLPIPMTLWFSISIS